MQRYGVPCLTNVSIDRAKLVPIIRFNGYNYTMRFNFMSNKGPTLPEGTNPDLLCLMHNLFCDLRCLLHWPYINLFLIEHYPLLSRHLYYHLYFSSFSLFVNVHNSSCSQKPHIIITNHKYPLQDAGMSP